MWKVVVVFFLLCNPPAPPLFIKKNICKQQRRFSSCLLWIFLIRRLHPPLPFRPGKPTTLGTSRQQKETAEQPGRWTTWPWAWASGASSWSSSTVRSSCLSLRMGNKPPLRPHQWKKKKKCNHDIIPHAKVFIKKVLLMLPGVGGIN